MSLSKPMLGFCQFGPRNKILWNSNRNTKIFINENAYEDIVCEMTAILSRGYELRPILRGCPIAMGHWLQHQGSNTGGCHNDDVTMSLMASQITSLTIVYSTVYSGADQRKHQSSASLAFVRGIHRGPVTRKMFHLMTSSWWVKMTDATQRQTTTKRKQCADFQDMLFL